MIHTEAWYREADDLTRQKALRKDYSALPRIVHEVYRRGDYRLLERIGTGLVRLYMTPIDRLIGSYGEEKIREQFKSLDVYLRSFASDLERAEEN